jgi:outer membrane biosynthesis protein TonB
VEDVRLLRGIEPLNDAAMAAVRQWVYEPTIVSGKPVRLVMTVTVNFVMN